MDVNSTVIVPLVIGGVLIATVVVGAALNKKRKQQSQKDLIEFFEKINQGDFSTFAKGKKLLQKYPNFPDVEPQNGEFETALMTACKYGREKEVVELLEIGSGIRRINKNNCNIVHLCCWEDNFRCLEEILNYIKGKNLNKDLEELINEKSKGGWTPLHIAAAKNSPRCFRLIMALSPSLPLPLNSQDEQGHTIFMMATANGFKEIFESLIHNEEVNIHLTNSKEKSSLYFAAINGNFPYVEAIVDRALREAKNNNEYQNNNNNVLYSTDLAGNSALHAACIGGHLKLVEFLSNVGLTLTEKSKSGDSVFHICVNRNTDNHLSILRFLCSFDDNNNINNENNNNILIEEKKKERNGGLNREKLYKMLLETTNFGSTPIHDAALSLNPSALDILLSPLSPDQRSTILNAKDNDGLTALHTLCRAVQISKQKQNDEQNNEEVRRAKVLTTIDKLVEFGANINETDFANANSLHLLCYSPATSLCIDALKKFLFYNINPFVVDSFGWTPLHALLQTSKHFPLADQMIDILKSYMQTLDPSFFDTFEPMKKRDLSNQDHLSLAGPQNRIPIEIRNSLLNGEISLKGIANYIKRKQKEVEEEGKKMKIVIMCGAGISVNSGIPDFRSRDSGLYAKKGNSDLFTLKTLVEEPDRFYSFLKENFLPLVSGSVKPTLTHSFFKLLEDKQLLKRIYTQNVDLLEEKAGIDEELIVTAHGSFKTAHCLSCLNPIAPSEMSSLFWDKVANGEIPSCPKCKSIVRPDIVFFGEPLHQRYNSLNYKDLSDCDLLIVLGTSLVVYPFASLLSTAPLLTPRVLINKELTGPFAKSHLRYNYRDVAYQGDCDDGVVALAEALGWKDELLSLYNSLNKN